MAKIPYYDNPSGSLAVTVELQHAADVYLVDQANFNVRQRGGRFQYFGGHYDQTPVTIRVSGSGRWYLIVDNGSGEQYRYTWSK
ncbi:MAG: DUF1883 domain-containing protein [Lactobacillus sp.]|jgi:hypothetical protein|uniref:DUF1883 domain-containing protein n=1 Tax=Lacticaseibacillus suilingensis TaxID=2799577 RepID=A0ABW4BI39_9LACO|nr:DUF1883 domain-containing protein [Lacticaseibacillus suilingensis]MCI1894166.1 DUF1883 domain-containing protein [Lactobacillus sp.]MCI1941482.1 DUF1883 domain-containing protein [Lactobacillus sp.]MCI1972007.1 DUF1883 domain-containing protein [Lactobacillus sp.]MCI2016150.1 DUF1883 domain-containing protein [Lactobacillus sp.]MCI2036417.1 DUF1883 domain-containing protein [Lactobacillus sp.]